MVFHFRTNKRLHLRHIMYAIYWALTLSNVQTSDSRDVHSVTSSLHLERHRRRQEALFANVCHTFSSSKMPFCGPKCSLCCSIVSVWGIIQLVMLFFLQLSNFCSIKPKTWKLFPFPSLYAKSDIIFLLYRCWYNSFYSSWFFSWDYSRYFAC